MANSKSMNTDPADALQGLINDALIQTGKALKSWSKDGRHQVQAQISMQTKMPEIIESFHWKLDDLESEIIRAKAVLQRDLDRIQEQRRPAQQPAPVEAQTKSPMAIDLDSSREPSPDRKPQITEASGPHRVPAEPSAAPSMAPFPDMGVSFQPPVESIHAIKQEPAPAPAPAPPAMMAPMDIKSEAKQDSATAQPQQSGAPEAPMDDLFGLGGDADGGPETNNSEFHFTDMTFSLAPPNNDSQGQPQSQDANMDMSFSSGDIGGDLLSLDSLLPPDNTSSNVKSEPAIPAAPGGNAPAPANNQDKPVEAKMEKQDSNLDDLFNLDSNTNLEGMDLDMYFDDTETGNFDDAFFDM
ncbi:hypothetical protein CkaCkLH20_07001 [Colletotrichum karsti]|uniref:Uncharacterized protein n=1 Tax=Colletotrichum karsti TaxID=1095194 RepID=A0A9P6IBJ6_9PEZI|nr:uncharacterized protein CkaCkLH20_07001 [Colletotrichum karsti]KAF9875620.1 hypothetical protein CkaCkLH20_07001 [Colletotrichum karsti]